MYSAAADFEARLELFRTEAESAIQFFYAWNAVHAVAARDKGVVRLLNQAPLFWNTSLGALQQSAIVTLGRIFDQSKDSAHNIDRLLKVAQGNPAIFSKDFLAERKRKTSNTADEWLPEYLQSAYEPSKEDFRRLRSHVELRRKIYVANYRPIRHNVYAHRGITTQAEVGALFANAKLREMQQILVFLGRMHNVLWELYSNGTKPNLRPQRYSVEHILDQPSPHLRPSTLQERLINEAKDFLTACAKQAFIGAE